MRELVFVLERYSLADQALGLTETVDSRAAPAVTDLRALHMSDAGKRHMKADDKRILVGGHIEDPLARHRASRTLSPRFQKSNSTAPNTPCIDADIALPLALVAR